MTNNEKDPQHQYEEIDLINFFKPLGMLLKKLLAYFSVYLNKLWQGKVLFISIVIFAVVIGYALRFVIPKRYSTEAIFISHSINGGLCSILINNLDEYADNRNPSILANQLKLPPSVAGTIKSLEATLMKDTFPLEEKDTVVSRFTVRLISTDNQGIAAIQRGIQDYLENNEYSRKRKMARLATINNLDSAYEKKLMGLDSLKKLINSSIVPRSTGQGIILGEPIDPVNVYQTEMNYIQERLKNKEYLASSDNIELLQPFFVPDSFNYPVFNHFLKPAFICGLLLALVCTPYSVRKATAGNVSKH
jgi:hypothetical protein